MYRLTSSIFDNIKSATWAHAQVLDDIQVFLDATHNGLTGEAFEFFDRVIDLSKANGNWSAREGVPIYQGNCEFLNPKVDGTLELKRGRLFINLTRAKLPDTNEYVYGFYIVVADSVDNKRAMHFSIDFDKHKANLFVISETSQILEGAFQKLENMFKPDLELMFGDKIEMCINHFVLNILYKYIVVSSLETAYNNEEFNI